MEYNKESYVEVDERYHNGVCLDEYKGIISICNADKSDEGEVYKSWCFPQRDRKPIEKAVPWGLRLGDKTSAISILKELLAGLEANVAAPKQPANTPVGTVKNDVPF